MQRLQSQMVAALLRHLKHREPRPMIPEAGRLLWAAFLDLDASRTAGANGPAPITFAEVEAWARLNRYPLEPQHVAVLRAMDGALIDAFHKEAKRQQAMKSSKANNARALTPAMFDARFTG